MKQEAAINATLAIRLEQIKSVRSAVATRYALLHGAQKGTAHDIVLPGMGIGMGRGMMHWE